MHVFDDNEFTHDTEIGTGSILIEPKEILEKGLLKEVVSLSIPIYENPHHEHDKSQKSHKSNKTNKSEKQEQRGIVKVMISLMVTEKSRKFISDAKHANELKFMKVEKENERKENVWMFAEETLYKKNQQKKKEIEDAKKKKMNEDSKGGSKGEKSGVTGSKGSSSSQKGGMDSASSDQDDNDTSHKNKGNNSNNGGSNSNNGKNGKNGSDNKGNNENKGSGNKGNDDTPNEVMMFMQKMMKADAALEEKKKKEEEIANIAKALSMVGGEGRSGGMVFLNLDDVSCVRVKGWVYGRSNCVS